MGLCFPESNADQLDFKLDPPFAACFGMKQMVMFPVEPNRATICSVNLEPR